LNPRIQFEQRRLEEFCRRWKVTELALFGSALREDFRPDSDIDVLISFRPDADWSLFDRVTMGAELTDIMGRKVDLVSRRGLERSSNWIRRKAILESAEPLYVAR
jgi:hypothetical protein